MRFSNVHSIDSEVSTRCVAHISFAFGTHVYNTHRIRDKLGVGTKQELVIWAVRNGLLDDVVVGR